MTARVRSDGLRGGRETPWIDATCSRRGHCGGRRRSANYGHGSSSRNAEILDRAKLTINDMDVIELNEAFASQSLAVLRELEIAADDPRVNPNGGAIALGHPLGASGARLIGTATYQLMRSRGKYALCTMCIGVGQGIAMILERV